MLGSGPHFLSTLTGSSCYTVLRERGSSKESLLVGWLQGLQLVLVTARLLFLLGIAVQNRSVLLASLFLFTGVGWGMPSRSLFLWVRRPFLGILCQATPSGLK